MRCTPPTLDTPLADDIELRGGTSGRVPHPDVEGPRWHRHGDREGSSEFRPTRRLAFVAGCDGWAWECVSPRMRVPRRWRGAREVGLRFPRGTPVTKGFPDCRCEHFAV